MVPNSIRRDGAADVARLSQQRAMEKFDLADENKDASYPRQESKNTPLTFRDL